jgi:hypothetical protein
MHAQSVYWTVLRYQVPTTLDPHSSSYIGLARYRACIYRYFLASQQLSALFHLITAATTCRHRQASLQPEATPLETPQEPLPSYLSTQRQEGDSRATLTRTISASRASSSTTSGEKRPRLAATGRKSLNVEQLPASSMLPQLTVHTDPSTSEKEDASMSDDPPSSC